MNCHRRKKRKETDEREREREKEKEREKEIERDVRCSRRQDFFLAFFRTFFLSKDP